MKKEGSIQDLKIWQKAKDLTKEAYDLSGDKSFASDSDMRSKLRTLSLSILTNVTKGYERYSKEEFAKYLASTKNACYGFQAFLYLLKDLGKLSENAFQKLYDESLDIVKMSAGLIKALKTPKKAA